MSASDADLPVSHRKSFRYFRQTGPGSWYHARYHALFHKLYPPFCYPIWKKLPAADWKAGFYPLLPSALHPLKAAGSPESPPLHCHYPTSRALRSNPHPPAADCTGRFPPQPSPCFWLSGYRLPVHSDSGNGYWTDGARCRFPRMSPWFRHRTGSALYWMPRPRCPGIPGSASPSDHFPRRLLP